MNTTLKKLVAQIRRSLAEVVVAVAAVSLIAGLGATMISGVKETSRKVHAQSDVAVLNRAMATTNAGGG